MIDNIPKIFLDGDDTGGGGSGGNDTGGNDTGADMPRYNQPPPPPPERN